VHWESIPSTSPGPLATPDAWAGVLLAFDFGEQRIGVAIGNGLTGGARPLATLPSTPVAQRFQRIEALIQEWQPTGLVVGLPVYPDGSPHPFAARCQRFARQLEGRFSRPVLLEDERYTSALAPGEAQIDAEAAAILLQGLLNAKVYPAERAR
jgi:putative Holliday junction resolvase